MNKSYQWVRDRFVDIIVVALLAQIFVFVLHKNNLAFVAYFGPTPIPTDQASAAVSEKEK